MRRWLRRGEDARDWASEQLERRGIRDRAVLAAMRAVPRDRFVPRELVHKAYDDGALAIGHGQTISQPYIVASMTQSLALAEWSAAHDDAPPRVLDVGTGSGYQAAVLAALGAEVVSIEIDPELAEQARKRLDELGYNVAVIVGDGSMGASDRAPFAGIVVAAAAPEVPQPLVDQLTADGRLVLPLGTRSEQVITLIRRSGSGTSRQAIERAVFVPLHGEHGFAER